MASKLIADVTNKVVAVHFYSDEYEGTAYNFAVLQFKRKSGALYSVRLKGLKDDSIVIVEDLSVPVRGEGAKQPTNFLDDEEVSDLPL